MQLSGPVLRVGAGSLAALLGVAGAWMLASADREGPGAPEVAAEMQVRSAARSSPQSDPTVRGEDPRSDRGPGTRGTAGTGGVPDRISGTVLPQSAPVALDAPGIGSFSHLVPLGLDQAGAMEVPQDPSLPGWYTLGPTPGQLGPAVIAGHSTWNAVPAAFYRLGRLAPGDPVRVTRRDGRVAVFSVTRVVQVSKQAFPTDAVYGATDHAALRLITCGGAYDAARFRYPDNIVVFARLVRVREHG